MKSIKTILTLSRWFFLIGFIILIGTYLYFGLIQGWNGVSGPTEDLLDKIGTYILYIGIWLLFIAVIEATYLTIQQEQRINDLTDLIREHQVREQGLLTDLLNLVKADSEKNGKKTRNPVQKK